MSRPDGIPAYIAVTAAYWAFMLTDGALRMLVLLHFHTLGYSPIQLAYLFLVYEFMGIVTNLSAGWLAARFGMTSTLYAGLALQIIALLALTQLRADWSAAASVVFVMLVQGLSGVAKELAKMSSKSAVKILAADTETILFKWVSLLTGSKNAVKGLGFLLGAGSLGFVGFNASLIGMAVILAIVLGAIVYFMPPGLPAGVKATKFRMVLSGNRSINRLSLAQLFLFGARDTWFVVGIPIFFYGVLSDGTPESARRAFFLIGIFMALWVIGYGIVQANAPRILGPAIASPQRMQQAKFWVGILALIPMTLAVITAIASTLTVLAVVVGLLLFGVVFALNSALHSFLILSFTSAGRVTMDVGFYYMANAAGRLLGTLLSGLSFQFGGISVCLATAALMAFLSWLVSGKLAQELVNSDTR
ncbi:MAG: organoarsenical effux MFS transporter ArsJ [Boseongicola sp.]|nr:MAG: organoarsenical effux MFS transporter ArsJ [Boseongicola sp.]